jgi:hypothetical protein
MTRDQVKRPDVSWAVVRQFADHEVGVQAAMDVACSLPRRGGAEGLDGSQVGPRAGHALVDHRDLPVEASRGDQVVRERGQLPFKFVEQAPERLKRRRLVHGRGRRVLG